MIQVIEETDGTLTISWYENDPVESILNTWTEEDFINAIMNRINELDGKESDLL